MIHINTRSKFYENNENREFVSTPSLNLRHKNFKTNINENEKMSFTN